eukprot:1158541-Pelagomonas_calceolata.AAC.6
MRFASFGILGELPQNAASLTTRSSQPYHSSSTSAVASLLPKLVCGMALLPCSLPSLSLIRLAALRVCRTLCAALCVCAAALCMQHPVYAGLCVCSSTVYAAPSVCSNAVCAAPSVCSTLCVQQHCVCSTHGFCIDIGLDVLPPSFEDFIGCKSSEGEQLSVEVLSVAMGMPG